MSRTSRRAASNRRRRKAQRRQKAAMRGEVKAPKGRNWLAVNARSRRGGPMADRRALNNKTACRGRVEA